MYCRGLNDYHARYTIPEVVLQGIWNHNTGNQGPDGDHFEKLPCRIVDAYESYSKYLS